VAEGEKADAQPELLLLLPKGVEAEGFRRLKTCGVLTMTSSASSFSMGSSSSSESLVESLSIIFTLPSELEMTLRSEAEGAPVLHCPNVGGSIAIALTLIFLPGIIMPFCVIVGEESGEASASVE
jgi:hypothetical protein